MKKLALTSLTASLALPVSAAVTAVTTSVSGGLENLDSVTVDDGRGVITAAQMINVTVISFNNGTNSTFNLIQAGGSGALPSPRQGVMEDFALNNGIINPGAGSPVTVGTTIDDSVVGLGLRFNSSITVAAAGVVDALFFDLSIGAAQSGDSVTIALLDATNSVIGTEVSFAAGDYGFNTDQADSQAVNVSGDANTLAELNTDIAVDGAVVDSYYNLLPLDFTDFGVAAGGQVHGLYVRGASIDPTLVAGLPSIPEPSSALLLLSSLVLLRRRR